MEDNLNFTNTTSSLYYDYNDYADGETTHPGNMLLEYIVSSAYKDDHIEKEINKAMARYLMLVNFLFYFYPIKIGVSFLGNLLVIVVVLHKKKGFTSTELYIVSLAVGDLLVNCTSSLNEYLCGYTFVQRTYSTLDCKLRKIIPVASHFISVWQLVVISTERAISVLIPHKARYICSVGTARTTVIMLWTGSLLTGIFINAVFYAERYSVFHLALACKLHAEATVVYSIFMKMYNFILFFIPYTWIFCCTIAIIITLAKRKMQIANKNVASSVTLTLICLNIIFLITQGPHHIYNIMKSTGYFDDYTSFADMIDIGLVVTVTTVLMDANSALNVFVYFLSGSRFRNDVKHLFKRSRLSPPRSFTDTTLSGSKRSKVHSGRDRHQH